MVIISSPPRLITQASTNPSLRGNVKSKAVYSSLPTFKYVGDVWNEIDGEEVVNRDVTQLKVFHSLQWIRF